MTLSVCAVAVKVPIYSCAVNVSCRCADTGGTESECTESPGRGGEGAAALEANRRGSHPAAERFRFAGVALLSEPGTLLPHVSDEGRHILCSHKMFTLICDQAKNIVWC